RSISAASPAIDTRSGWLGAEARHRFAHHMELARTLFAAIRCIGFAPTLCGELALPSRPRDVVDAQNRGFARERMKLGERRRRVVLCDVFFSTGDALEGALDEHRDETRAEIVHGLA